MKKKSFIFIFLAILLFSAYLSYFQNQNKVNSVCIENKKCFKVELAQTEKEQEIGLMNHLSLAKNSGMLFIFPNEKIRGFWMKSMNFAIDMIWINSDFKIVGFEKNVKPCRENCEIYYPDEKIKYVLEISANFSDKFNFETGDKVVFVSEKI